MNDLESSAFGITQDTFDMLPKSGFSMRCEDLWPFCW